MDGLKQHIKEACLVEQPAYCTGSCPFGLDVPDFIEKIQRKGFSAAFRAYRNAVVFPEIVSHLCKAPCKAVCPRADVDEAIDLPMLERAVVSFVPNKNPNCYNLPLKKQRVAIIGAGISGLTCALRLASNKYNVTVYEKSHRIGGHLWGKLAPEIFLSEIEREFSQEDYILKRDTEITSLDELDADAVYIATGSGGNDFGMRTQNGIASVDRPGVFLGGALCGADTIQAIVDGHRMMTLIEHFLKTGNMIQADEWKETLLHPADRHFRVSPRITAQNGSIYSQEEAISEAKRCLRCSCDACKRSCDMMEYYNKLPPRIAEEVSFTIHPAALWGKETFAKRMMESCNQCGACENACPRSLDLGELILEGRRIMRNMGKQAWVFHDYWLRDMEHAIGEAHFVQKPEGVTTSSLAFFPGCQLGASDPRYVIESYQWILDHSPDTSLWLSCCGVPAIWAGDEEKTEKVVAALKKDWEYMGKPEIIFACPTCKKTFAKYFPEIKGRYLFEWMAETAIVPKRELRGEYYAVFDPCASRHDFKLQMAVRELSKRAGALLETLPEEGEEARCCSWGGHVSIANPDYAKKQTALRIEQSRLPYIAYCSNCRDIFSDAGKSCLHILDILFDLGDMNRQRPSCTKRRENRQTLIKVVLQRFWNEEIIPNQNRRAKLLIDKALEAKMSQDLIVEEDAAAAIEFCEKTGQTIIDCETGYKTGCAVIGKFTYWVTYCNDGELLQLLNVYCHRMNIRMEETWNGKLRKDDL